MTNIPGPSSAVSDPSPAHIPSATPSSFTTTSTSTPATLPPPSQSSTTPPLTSNSPSSPSASRNFQTSLQPSSSSSSPSPSPSSTQAQQGTNNNSSLSGHTKLILATVFPIVGIITLILGIWWMKHTKKPPPSKEESDNSSSNPTSNHLPSPGQPTPELDGDRGGELDASPTEGTPSHHELASRERYEMGSMRGERSGRNTEMGIQELNGDREHPGELD